MLNLNQLFIDQEVIEYIIKNSEEVSFLKLSIDTDVMSPSLKYCYHEIDKYNNLKRLLQFLEYRDQFAINVYVYYIILTEGLTKQSIQSEIVLKHVNKKIEEIYTEYNEQPISPKLRFFLDNMDEET